MNNIIIVAAMVLISLTLLIAVRDMPGRFVPMSSASSSVVLDTRTGQTCYTRRPETPGQLPYCGDL